METVILFFFFWTPKSLQMVTTAMKLKDAFSLEEKLLPTKLDSILKSRDVILPTKVHLLKAMVFPVVMYGCESWTIKKAECQNIDAFELWCWRRLLRVPWTGKEIQPVHPKGDQSWVFIGRTDAEAETPILWPPDVKNWLIGKDPDAGKRLKAGGKGDDGGWDGWMASPTWWTWVWASSRSWWWTRKWCAAVHGVAKSWTQLGNWVKLKQIPRSQ